MSFSGILEQIIDLKIIKTGNFQLKSGQQSNVYINLRSISSYPILFRQILRLLVNKLDKIVDSESYPLLHEWFIPKPTLVGVPYGAIILASGLSLESQCPLLLVRKESKQHGTQQLIEGSEEAKKGSIVIIEDVVTTGSSVVEIVTKLREHGLKVDHVLSVVDRQQGSKKLFEEHNLTHHSLLTMNDIQFRFRSIQSVVNMKKTNLVFSADLDQSTKALDLINQVGPYVTMVKLHLDLFDPLEVQVRARFFKRLNRLRQKHRFYVIDDRKYADIGSICQRQYLVIDRHFKVDFITCHLFQGSSAIKSLLAVGARIFLIAEMSTHDHLFNNQIKQECIKLIQQYSQQIVGVVSQTNFVPDDLGIYYLRPGIKLTALEGNTGDGQGQVYRTPNVEENVLWVVGRDIYQSTDPVKVCQQYQQLKNESTTEQIE